MENYKKLLLFRMDGGRTALIRQLCDGLGIRAVSVYQQQYGETIGALAGISVFPLTHAPYRGDGFEREMMVICGLNSDGLDEFLAAWRDAGLAPVGLKATLTPCNMSWTAARLYEELSREHAQFGN